MFACVRACISAPLSLSSVRSFTNPLKDWKWRGKWWKEVESEAIQDLASHSYAGRHL